MTSEYVLYCFAQSGNAYKAALMLNLCGAEWSPRFVDYFNRAVDTPKFRAINEMGEVPVLAFLSTRSNGALNVLDKHLEKQQFAIGDRPTIADLSMCGYPYFTDEIGVDLNQHPAVVQWLGDIKKLDRWMHPYELMPGHPLQ
jgi:glutathione S-transferase